MAALREALTQGKVNKAKAGAKETTIWDADCPKLGLRIRPSGAKSYICRYRSGGEQRRVTIGDAESVGLLDARKAVFEILGDIARGRDPGLERQIQRKAPTVAKALDLWMKEKIEPNRKPATIKEYRRIIDNLLPDNFKRKKIRSVVRPDCVVIFESLKRTPTQANRVMAVMHSFFNWTEGDGNLRDMNTNPVHQINRNTEKKRKFSFSNEELAKLGQTIREAEAKEWPFALMALWFILFTGCRKNEALNIEWKWVDFDRRIVHLPDTKTGERDIPLNDYALAILRRAESLRSALGGPFVFPSPNNRKRPFVGIQKVWERIRNKAGFPGVRLHDLRHNMGGRTAVKMGSAVFTKALLGHANLASSERYISPQLEAQLDASNQVSAEIFNALTGASNRTENPQVKQNHQN